MLKSVLIEPSNKSVGDLFPGSFTRTNNRIDLKYPCSSSITCTPYELKFKPGTYTFEIWGSYSTYFVSPGGAGYVKGTLTLRKDTVLYAYVGKVGTNFNFGVQSYRHMAGAATDIRTENGEWDSVTGRRSRIMVAGGGGDCGGLNSWNTGNPYSGPSGGVNGYPGGDKNTGKGGAGATQTDGSGFGISGVSCAGGNGYYSGFPGHFVNGAAGGGGGSSFVSGFYLCNAIDSDGVHTGSPYHYSKYVFSSPDIIGGLESMKLPDNSIRKGYIGDSILRITLEGISKRKATKLIILPFLLLISYPLFPVKST